jgi:hypothetical protein
MLEIQAHSHQHPIPPDAIDARRSDLAMIMWGTDTDLRLQWIRGGADRMLGMDQMSVIGARVEAMFKSPAHPFSVRHRQALLGDGNSFQAEWLDRPYEIWIEPLRDENGHVTGTVTVAFEISDAGAP